MLVKINGSLIVPERVQDGLNIQYDLQHTFHDAFLMVHTPVNLDISYAGYKIAQGDANVFNWAHSAITKGIHAIDTVIDYLL